MDASLLRMIAAAVILVLAVLVGFPPRKRIERAGRRWAQEWQAYVPAELVPAFDARTRANFRWGGVWVAAIAVAVGIGLFDKPGSGPFMVFVTASLVPLMVWRAVRGMPALRARGVTRVAHVRASRFTDYLPLWSVLVVVTSAFGPTVFLGAINPAAWGHGGLFAATVVQAVSGLLAAAVVVKVAGTSLPAADLTQLYLQDADRASSMCSALFVPAWASMFLVQQIQLNTFIDGLHVAQASIVLAWLPLAALGLVRESAKRRFRRRLWSMTTPWQEPGPLGSQGAEVVS